MKSHSFSLILSMILLSWNVRGLGAKIKRSVLRKIILTHEPWFSFIQETKLETLSPIIIRSIWKCNDLNLHISPSIGNSGGLISFWRESKFQCEFHHCNRNWIAVGGCLVNSNFQCLLINSYNSCESWGERRNMEIHP